MQDWGKNEEFLIKITKEQAHKLITEYYKEYENFNGEIELDFYWETFSPGYWGINGYEGKLDLKFIEKLKVLDQEIERTTYIRYKDLDFLKIFSPFFTNEEYELTNKWSVDIDVDEDEIKITYNGIRLWAKRKEKEKILKK